MSVHPGPCAGPLTQFSKLERSCGFSTMSNRIQAPPFDPTQTKKFYPVQKVHSDLRVSKSAWKVVGEVEPFLCLGIPRTLWLKRKAKFILPYFINWI